MTLLFFSSDILSYIMNFVDDMSNSRFTRTCKTLHSHSNKHGFVKEIHANIHTNMITFIRRFHTHTNTIQKVFINRVDDPHIWLPKYTEHLNFDHCAITEYLNPGKQGYIVKSLKITDYNRYKDKTKID